MTDPHRTSFLQALQLPADITDEACTRSITELISLAAKDDSRLISIRDIHDAAIRYDCAEFLEPLDILPILLPCHQDGAMELIRLCASKNSAKEVMIVLQEEMEHLKTCLNNEEDEEESDLVQSVIGIVSLCFPAISRSRPGKRSELELCSPIIENLTSLISSVSPLATREEGCALITEVAGLTKTLCIWASAITNAAELQQIKILLRELLDMTVIGCASSIQVALAVRAAQSHFPRSFVKIPSREDWKDGATTMLQVQLALEHLGDSWRKPKSFSDLMYLAHSTPPVALSAPAPSDLYWLIINALQMNTIIDESMFLLLRILTHENMSLPPDVAISLCTVLTALASTHLDPTIRQLNLRLLSLTLTKLPSAPRIEILLRLTTDEDFPQIRGPAVAFVKEAVLEALALPPEHVPLSPFVSPELLRIFGGVLFRPNPPDFFDERKTREELAQSLELLRIADCLSFYYVLLQRDRENKTGVRSRSNVISVERSMLQPLRQFLDAHLTGQEQPLMALLSLQVSLDRIDGAVALLDMNQVT